MYKRQTYDYAVALRAVKTIDFMTAESAEIPYAVLNKVTVSYTHLDVYKRQHTGGRFL